MTVQVQVLESTQRPGAVVAPGHRLEQQPASGRSGFAHGVGQPRRQRTRALDNLREQLSGVGAVGTARELRDVLLHLGVHPLSGRRDQRLVEIAETDLPSQIGDHRVAPFERGDEPRRQSLGLGVERAQPRMQVLLRAVQRLRFRLRARSVGTRHGAEVGEHCEQAMLAGDQGRIAGEQVRALAVQVGDRSLHVRRADVISERQPLHPAQVLLAAVRLRVRGRGGQGSERDALAGRRSRAGLDRLEGQERRVRVDVHVVTGEHLLDPAPERRRQRRLHLHRLDHCDHLSRVDNVTCGDPDRHHQCGAGRVEEAGVVARHSMWHAVDLDEQAVALPRDQRPVGLAEQFEPSLVRPEPSRAHLDRLAVDRDAVAVGGDERGGEAVGMSAVAQFVGARQRARRLGASAASERVKTRPVIRGVPVGQFDRRL